MTFAYDPLGRLLTVTDALGHVTAYGYDEVGNKLTQTDAEGRVTLRCLSFGERCLSFGKAPW
jgi:YD repeat-containing protein